MTQVPTALTRAAWSALGSIPGCALESLSGGAGPNQVVLRGVGWSPTLHWIRLQWEVELGLDPTLHRDAGVDRLLERLSTRLDEQRRRSDAGCVLGSAVPLRVDGGAPSPVDHLHVDVSLMAFLLDAADLRCADASWAIDQIGHAVCALHANHGGHDGGHDLLGRETQVSVRGDMRIASPSWKLEEGAIALLTHPANRYMSAPAPKKRSAGDPPTVTATGTTILVSGAALPQTVLAGACGRRVGDLAALHPFLDGRRIASATGGDDWFVVGMEEAPMRVGDVRGLTGVEAMRMMEDLLPGWRGDGMSIEREKT